MINICLILSLTISLILLLFGLLTNSCNLILLANSTLIIFNVIYSIKKTERRITFLMFNISFFTLLIGKNLLNMLNNANWYNEFPIEIQINTQCLLFASLFSLFVGNVICELSSKKSNNSFNNIQVNNIKKNECIRAIIKKIYFFVMIFAFIVSLEKGLYVLRNNYIDLYTSFAGSLPSIVYKIANLSSITFCLYLATFPPKKTTFKIFSSYLIYLCTTLLSGERSTFVIGIFIIVVYLFIRNKKDKEVWITNKMKMIGVIGAFFIVIFLGWYNSSRNGVDAGLNMTEYFLKFFDDQGGSVNLITYAQVYKDKLPSTNTNYTFSSFINFYKYSTIGKIINFSSAVEPTDKIEVALYGNNLGATISYLVLKNQYLNGHGLGTQYIAELFIDYGYIGVIIFNIAIGYIITKLTYLNYNNCYKFALLLCALSEILYIPRNFATTWFVNTFFSIMNWGLIFLIYILSNRMYKNKLIEGGNI